MKSIRLRLLLAILPALAILWLGAAALIYFSTRQALYREVGQELRLLANEAPIFLIRSNERMRRRRPDREDIFNEGGRYYFQSWKQDGTDRRKSDSLGEQSLFQDQAEDDGRFREHQLADGTPVYQLTLTRRIRLRPLRPRGGPDRQPPSRPEERAREFTFSVGRDVSEIAATLAHLRKVIGWGTLGGIGIVGLVVIAGIRSGLKPLGQLRRELDAINAHSLDSRLDPSTSPDEVREVPETINALLSRLEEAFEKERRFGADLAHEIRTPVAEIRATAELGLSWPDSFGSDELESIHASSCRIHATTEAIFALTRAEEMGEIIKEAIPLAEVIRDCLPEERPITISGPEEVQLTTHRPFLDVILRNLFTNAATYAPPDDQIHVQFDSAQLTIDNAAPDLTESDLPLLFDRFWRKDSSRHAADHAGLGLRLVKSCAERLGYQVEPSLHNGRLSITVRF